MLLRDPEINATATLAETKEWHKDDSGYGVPASIQFIVWSNAQPTEIRLPDGSLLETKDGDVILIDNVEVEHRAPAAQINRWFVRTGLVVTTDG
jgi:hypothetical protein